MFVCASVSVDQRQSQILCLPGLPDRGQIVCGCTLSSVSLSFSFSLPLSLSLSLPPCIIHTHSGLVFGCLPPLPSFPSPPLPSLGQLAGWVIVYRPCALLSYHPAPDATFPFNQSPCMWGHDNQDLALRFLTRDISGGRLLPSTW